MGRMQPVVMAPSSTRPPSSYSLLQRLGFGCTSMGIHHIVNRRMGGESPILGATDIQRPNCAESFHSVPMLCRCKISGNRAATPSKAILALLSFRAVALLDLASLPLYTNVYVRMYAGLLPHSHVWEAEKRGQQGTAWPRAGFVDGSFREPRETQCSRIDPLIIYTHTLPKRIPVISVQCSGFSNYHSNLAVMPGQIQRRQG